MPVGKVRDRTLYGLGDKRGRLHRYTVIRWGIGVVSTVAVAALPFTNTLRLDLWSGRHYFLGEEVGTVEGIKAFAFPFLAVNIAIILASRFLGRWLCGFGCPIGNLNRLREWIGWRTRKGRGRVVGELALFLVTGLLAVITFSFWVDWGVFFRGSPLAVTLSAGFLLGTQAVLYGIVRGMGMRFCRDYCPSGVYFALLGPTSATGVVFAHPDNCTDCHACENACPVDLQPRELLTGAQRGGIGFYPDAVTNLANCLRCGDCVNVCEEIAEGGEQVPDTPLALGLLDSAQRVLADARVGGGSPSPDGESGGGDDRSATR